MVVTAVVVGAGAVWGLWSFGRLDRKNLSLSDAAEGEPQNYLLIGSDSRDGIERSDPGSGAMLAGGSPGGRRSDSIEIVRIDPRSTRISMLSIPRDLWLPIANTGTEQRINTAYSTSVQNVVDTIEKNLGIPVHHYVEVDFKGFQELVDTIGGVPLYFNHPVRDRNSGLRVDQKGCAVLDGYQGLAFARSRHLEWSNGSQWVSDPSADLGRMARQQALARAAMGRLRSMGLGDVGRVTGLVDAAVGNVTLDDQLGVGDILGLARRFAEFDPATIQTYALPTTPHTTDGGAAVLLLDPAAAQPTLDVFRGASTPAVTTTTAPPVRPADVTVSIYNGSPTQGEARRVSYVLSAGGFALGEVGNPDGPVQRTTVRFAKGGRAMGELVAAWLGPAPKLVEDAKVTPGSVRVDLGTDFATVAEPSAKPTTTTTAVASPATASGGSAAAPATTTTTEPGWTPSAPPPGVRCG